MADGLLKSVKKLGIRYNSIKMNIVGMNINTFEAKVILGLKVGYSEELITLNQVKSAIREIAPTIEGYTFSGTLTPGEIIVAGKNEYQEPCILITTSIYPRFPQEKTKFKKEFIEFIGKLAEELKQERIGITFTDESLMIETKYCKHPDIK